LLTFFAAAKKVSAAPHRDEANRPITIQGKANAIGKQPKTNPTRRTKNQEKTNTIIKTTKKQPPARQNQTSI
jgi:hypothetical protein